MTPVVIDAEFVLRIDGQKVIQDKNLPFGGSSQTFIGAYRGRVTSARATQARKWARAFSLSKLLHNGPRIDSLTTLARGKVTLPPHAL